MRDHLVRKVDTDYPNLTTEQKIRKRSEECAAYLHSLRHSDPEHYNDIISILGFFETLGYIVDKGYISASDIVNLFGPPIQSLDELCWDHIQKRIEEGEHETGAPTLLWEHACNLIVSTREWYSQQPHRGRR